MLLIQTGPAETTNYMIAAYVVIFGSMLIYLLSLILRKRNLEQNLHLLEDEEQN